MKKLKNIENVINYINQFPNIDTINCGRGSYNYFKNYINSFNYILTYDENLDNTPGYCFHVNGIPENSYFFEIKEGNKIIDYNTVIE